jgi:hypothetical protein
VTATESKGPRRVSPWASLACIPVCLMTVIPYWIFAIQQSPSISATLDQRAAAIRHAMTYAGLAILLSILVWRRASAVSLVVLGSCVITNLYTLFVVSGQRLHALMGRW